MKWQGWKELTFRHFVTVSFQLQHQLTIDPPVEKLIDGYGGTEGDEVLSS